MSGSETNSGEARERKTFYGLLVVTLVYFGVYYLLVLETKSCDTAEISPNWFFGFWDRYLGCRGINELGDALAGAFAPVAFLWLAGTVLIQSQAMAKQLKITKIQTDFVLGDAMPEIEFVQPQREDRAPSFRLINLNRRKLVLWKINITPEHKSSERAQMPSCILYADHLSKADENVVWKHVALRDSGELSPATGMLGWIDRQAAPPGWWIEFHFNSDAQAQAAGMMSSFYEIEFWCQQNDVSGKLRDFPLKCKVGAKQLIR